MSGGAIVGTGSNAAPVVGRTGMSGFGEFTLGGDSGSNSLPVTWLSFEGKRNSEGVLLNWKTVKEINNDYFVVERKTSTKKEFEPIAKILPANNAGINMYNFLDKATISADPILYRIKQVDLDGSYNFSKTLTILDHTDLVKLKAYPNPTNDAVYLENFESVAKIELINDIGKFIDVLKLDPKIELASYNTGLYFLAVTYKDGSMEAIKIFKH